MCPGPLLWVTTRLALALRDGVRGLPLLRTGHARALGLSVPPPSGGVEVDHSGPLQALDIDQDFSFRSVLALIKNFHNMEAPAGVPSARCRTSLASIYGFMSETSPAFHLPPSPLLQSLLDDTNLALPEFLEDQTVHGFLPVPSCRHCR